MLLWTERNPYLTTGRRVEVFLYKVFINCRVCVCVCVCVCVKNAKDCSFSASGLRANGYRTKCDKTASEYHLIIQQKLFKTRGPGTMYFQF